MHPNKIVTYPRRVNLPPLGVSWDRALQLPNVLSVAHTHTILGETVTHRFQQTHGTQPAIAMGGSLHPSMGGAVGWERSDTILLSYLHIGRYLVSPNVYTVPGYYTNKNATLKAFWFLSDAALTFMDTLGNIFEFQSAPDGFKVVRQLTLTSRKEHA